MGRERIKGFFLLPSPEETLLFGARFAKAVQPGDILALKGDLGAGKTTFMQGFLKELNIEEYAQSPTFTILQSYAGLLPVHHFDLYRIKTENEFIRLGFDEFFNTKGAVAIEWPERIESLLPPDAYLIEFSYGENSGRTATVKLWGER